MSSRPPHKHIHKQDACVRGKVRLRTPENRGRLQPCGTYKKAHQMSNRLPHKQNTQAGTLRPWESQIPDSCTKVDPCHVEFTRKPRRCRTRHTHQQNTKQESTQQHRCRHEAPAEKEPTPSRRATAFHHLAQPLATSIIYHNTRHKQESRRRPRIQAHHPTLQRRLPAWQNTKQKKKSADTGKGHQPCE